MKTKVQKIQSKEQIIDGLYKDIETIIINNKNKMIYQINNTLVNTYFMIGKVIVENEQKGNFRAEYGKDILKNYLKN